MNIKEVARQAGVSVATVSRVLNHPELVQPETKTRVLSVMEALHYTPNWFARGLNLGKTRTIALLVSNIERGTDRDLFAGVETVALKKGYATFLCNTHGSAAAEADGPAHGTGPEGRRRAALRAPGRSLRPAQRRHSMRKHRAPPGRRRKTAATSTVRRVPSA